MRLYTEQGGHYALDMVRSTSGTGWKGLQAGKTPHATAVKRDKLWCPENRSAQLERKADRLQTGTGSILQALERTHSKKYYMFYQFFSFVISNAPGFLASILNPTLHLNLYFIKHPKNFN